MKHLFLFTLIILLFPAHAQVQSARGAVSVTGKVVDAQGRDPLPGAYVHLTRLADTTQQVTATAVEGTFAFAKVKPGPYSLKVTFMGFQPFTRTFEVKNEALDLGELAIRAEMNMLGEVVIETEAAAAEVYGDTIAFNAKAYKTSLNANADQLVEKLPGVVIEDGQIEAQGEPVTRVTVDGKMFFGDDAMAVLQNLPADLVDKVEMFDRQSEQAELTGIDDGERFKTLNIVTKKSMRVSKFGQVLAGAGTQDRYIAGGKLNLFQGKRRITVVGQSNNINQRKFSADDFVNPGGRGITRTNLLALNYTDQWGLTTEVEGSYFYNNTDNNSFRNVNRQYVTGRNAGQEYLERTQSNSQNQQHRFNLRLTYKPTKHTTIRITPRLNLQQGTDVSTLAAETFAESTLFNQTNNRRNADDGGIDFDNQFLVSHRFAKPGRTVSVNIRTDFNNQEGESFLYSRNESFSGAALTQIVDQGSLRANRGYSLSANLNLTEKLGKRGIVLLNYNTGYRNNDADQRTYLLTEAQRDFLLLDTALTNTFSNQYITHRVGPGYRYITPKLHVSTQVSYQSAVLDRQQVFPTAYGFGRSFASVLPRASLRYKIREKQNLTLNYRTGTNAPSANQMQEVINNNNPLQLRTGNPLLDQSYQHRLDARYTYAKPETSQVLSASLHADMEQNWITNSTFIADDTVRVSPTILLPAGGQLSRPVNLDGRYSLRANASYGLPLRAIKSKLNLNLNASRSRSPGMVNEQLNYSNSTGLGMRVGVSSNISENLDFNLSTRSRFSTVTNTLRPEVNNRYLNQSSQARVRWILWSGLILESDVNHRLNRGLAADFNQSFTRWNASIGKTVFADRRGEIKLTGYDILNQNTNISRDISDIYIQDVESQVLTRFFMLSFTYNFRSAGAVDH